jgi:pentatricopeptide repeat protein
MLRSLRHGIRQSDRIWTSQQRRFEPSVFVWKRTTGSCKAQKTVVLSRRCFSQRVARHKSSTPAIPPPLPVSWQQRVTTKQETTTTNEWLIDKFRRKLPVDVRWFLDELDGHVRGKSLSVDAAKLKALVAKHGDKHPDTCRLLLERSLEFEARFPDCKGLLVDGDCFLDVIQQYVARDKLDQAEEVHALGQSVEYIQLDYDCTDIILKGYAKRKTREALQRIKEIMRALEDERLQAPASQFVPLNCYKYNILLEAYIGVLGKEAPNSVRQTLERMEDIAWRLDDGHLRPDLKCYATLVKACVIRGQRWFASEVTLVLDLLKADLYYLNQPAQDMMALESLVIDAWSKSVEKRAPKKARQIFDAMQEPTSLACSALCSIYAKLGRLGEVFRLYDKMQARNDKDLCLDMKASETILKALETSDRRDAAEKADRIFNALPLPNTTTYNSIINVYARGGHAQKIIDLDRRLLSDSKTGTNKHCRPHMHTYVNILIAVQKTGRPDVPEIGDQIFTAIPLPNTVTYNALIHIYAEFGLVNKILSLYRQMQLDYQSRKNPDCRPNTHTFNGILNALDKSNRPDAAALAEPVFNEMPRQDTVAYNTLLTLYAKSSMEKEALALMRRMRSDFSNRKNINCKPDAATRLALLNALASVSDPALKKEGKDVLEWFRDLKIKV